MSSPLPQCAWHPRHSGCSSEGLVAVGADGRDCGEDQSQGLQLSELPLGSKGASLSMR